MEGNKRKQVFAKVIWEQQNRHASWQKWTRPLHVLDMQCPVQMSPITQPPVMTHPHRSARPPPWTQLTYHSKRHPVPISHFSTMHQTATGYASQHIWWLSQARINWEGCVRKGILRKNGGDGRGGGIN